MADAVVVGSGPNGLVAANLLADGGWSVWSSRSRRPGGAVRSGEVTEPGFVTTSSALLPARRRLADRRLRLEEHGLRWRHAAPSWPTRATTGLRDALHGPEGDGGLARRRRTAATARRRLDCAMVGAGRPRSAMVEALHSAVPAVSRPARRIAARRSGRRLGTRPADGDHAGLRRHGRGALLGRGGAACSRRERPPRRPHPGAAPGGALFGWVLWSLGQQVGFPSARGRGRADHRRPGRDG